ncbi:MAG: DUF104 domain-containing protein [Chloroflexi bacterium]|nr:DUF104 domain-containing protein [Chloroflexota bacterium]
MITVIYEDGVLRPLIPLPLPEHTRMQIQIVDQPAGDEERARVYRVLIDAGLINPVEPSPEKASISEEELDRIAHSLARGGTLSDSIAIERAGR